MSGTKIHWLGTGGGLNVALGNTSFLMSANGTAPLMIDCGFTVPGKLMEIGRIEEVTDIVITHLHADHIGGLETFGFYRRFVCGDTGDRRPTLRMPNAELAHDLWENALKAGLGLTNAEDGSPVEATLETYYKVEIGVEVEVAGLPKLQLVETPHVHDRHNFAMHIGPDVFYSGDTVDLPPHAPGLIFQDCQFGPPTENDIHISYERLRDELPPEVKEKTYLVHITHGYEKVDPVADGFAGYVAPDQVFEI